MSSVLTIYLWLIGGLPLTILAWKCFIYPVKHIENGCVARNLIVHDKSQNFITDDESCDEIVERNEKSINLKDPPEVAFIRTPDKIDYNNTKFLLVILDNTNKRVVQMTANISPNPDSRKKVYPPNGDDWCVLKDYEEPKFDNEHHIYELEFLVFSHSSNFGSSCSGIYEAQFLTTPFDIVTWLNRHVKRAELLFCGPIAGAMVRVIDDKYIPPPTTTTLFPPHKPPTDSAFRLRWSAGLTSVIFVTVLFSYVIK